MKWQKSKQTANRGVLFVENTVNNQGSIFRRVHQEEDVGIDGFIEIVRGEEVSGKLLAVQIKSGDSFLSDDRTSFEVVVDEKHLQYWRHFMVPVLLVCYSPSLDIAAWISIRDHLDRIERVDARIPAKIVVPLSKKFDVAALDGAISGLADVRFDERLLLKCADKCLSVDPLERQEGFYILSQHPDSRDLKIVCHLARMLLFDENTVTAKEALFILGYGAGRFRWSDNPGNPVERDVMSYVHEICSDLSEEEIRKLIELIDDEHFSGPSGLGERCYDILSCCFERALEVLYAIADDNSQPMRRRANALYMTHECNDDLLQEAVEYIGQGSTSEVHDGVAAVYRWMLTGD